MSYPKELLLITLLSIIIASNLYDFATDYREGADRLHLVGEWVVITLSTTLIGWLLTDLRRQRRALAQLREEIRAGREQPRTLPPAAASMRQQLGGLIQQQFRAWELTDSEQQVGLLLLKGLSFKEIAALRDTQEKTVRAQASSIYRKAGVNGRHAFSAWFIEDFL